LGGGLRIKRLLVSTPGGPTKCKAKGGELGLATAYSLGGTLRLDAFHVLSLDAAARHLEIVVRLQVDPELWAVAEMKAESECRVCRDAPSVVDDFGDPVWRDADSLGQLVCERPYSLRNSSLSISPGVTGANSCRAIANLRVLVIVRD
jgi:hypothetical protein